MVNSSLLQGGDGQPDVANYKTDLPQTNLLQAAKGQNLELSSSQFDVTQQLGQREDPLAASSQTNPAFASAARDYGNKTNVERINNASIDEKEESKDVDQ